MHSENAFSPIIEIVDGITTYCNDLSLEKAFCPITKTDVGIVIDVNALQP